jgi:long-chain fatty acid transport protein
MFTMCFSRATTLSFGLIGTLALDAPATDASNGMNMIGHGAESIAMGGADLAVVDNPAAMNINPAGIGLCTYPQLDLGVGRMNPSLHHTDNLGNDQGDVLDRYPIPSLGLVLPVKNVTVGVGLFVQGGMGAEYAALTTPFSAMQNSGVPPGFFDGDVVPATDVTRTKLAHVKVTPTIAWRALPALSVGVALNVSYVRADMAFFPGTSVFSDLDQSGTAGDSPRDAFFGIAVEDASTVGYGLLLGAQYQRGRVSLGAAYCTETDLNLDGGTMNMNFSALGLGEVGYDAQLSGLAWPRQAGLGLAYNLSPSALIATDVDWVQWSSAIETVSIEGTNPDRPGAPPSREIPMAMGWEDQWVWAIGAELTPWRAWAFRVGYNHGISPVPDSMLRPLFPAIAENHVTGGIGFRAGPWTFDTAIEYVIEAEKTNNNPDPTINPFGPGYQERLSQFVGHFTLRRAFSR